MEGMCDIACTLGKASIQHISNTLATHYHCVYLGKGLGSKSSQEKQPLLQAWHVLPFKHDFQLLFNLLIYLFHFYLNTLSTCCSFIHLFCLYLSMMSSCCFVCLFVLFLYKHDSQLAVLFINSFIHFIFIF